MEAWETLAATHGVSSHYRNRAVVVRRQAAGGLSSQFFIARRRALSDSKVDVVHLYYDYSCPPAEAQGGY